MKRKVIKQGNGTLTMTLPSQWVKEVGLTGDDEIEITVSQNHLTVSPTKPQKERIMSINVDKFARLSFAKFLIACYEQGFDTIDLIFTKSHAHSWSHGKESFNDMINFFVTRLVGFEVLSQTKNKVRIGNITEKHMKFESILSRIFFLIEEYLENLTKAFESNEFSPLDQRESRHDNIAKMIALAIRIVHDSPQFTKVEAMNYITILNLLDKITDFIRYAYKYTSLYNKKVSQNTINLSKKAFRFLELYRHFFNKFEYSAISELDYIRGEVKKTYLDCVSKSSKESAINGNFDALVETLHGAIKPRIALELVDEGFR